MKKLVLALVGKPNSGKTTLYNWLTRSHFKTVNYPGATVEVAIGSMYDRNGKVESVEIIDTPGVYSLDSKSIFSEDEQVTASILDPSLSKYPVDAVALVMDATQLERQTSVLNSVRQSGRPFFVVLTMSDLLKNSNTKIDLKKLSELLSGIPILEFDGILGGGLDQVTEIIQNIQTIPQATHRNQPVMITQADLEKTKIGQFDHLSKTLKIDRWLLHPVFGYVFFIAAMTFLFSMVYWAAEPFMGYIDDFFAWGIDSIKNNISGLPGEFIADGLVAAIGGIVIFAPQIFILFLGIGILESSGYLARVAVLINRPLEKIGLGGRSFVPLLSGFACAIPAIMATRNIPSKKEKFLAQMMIPIMTCSARLPVFGLLIGFIFLGGSSLLAGLTMAGLYFLSILLGAMATGVIDRIQKRFSKDIAFQRKSHLSLELPMYRRPLVKIIFKGAFEKLKAFLKRAGPIIFVLSVVLWFATNFPRTSNTGVEIPSDQIASSSYAAQLGQSIEPVFYPMGVDWRVGFGLMSAFAAREVFVASTALVFNIQAEDEEEQASGLMKAMKVATFESGPLQGRAIFTIASCAGLLIFFIVALQCVSTFGILKQETGSLNFALSYLILSNLAAYLLATSVFQVLRAFGY